MTEIHSMYSDTCGSIDVAKAGTEVTLTGWVDRRRDHGGLIFVDLRDRYGIVQLVFDPEKSGEYFALAERIRPEWVILAKGVVSKRSEDTINPNMPTGEVEVFVQYAEVLNESNTPPFPIQDGIDTDELTRLRYRYLDIRRPEVAKALMLRDRVNRTLRKGLEAHGFTEIETPILGKSTPEGARDFIVPSRTAHGSFYALPQSPQLYKQLLMVAGMERYFQVLAASVTKTSAPIVSPNLRRSISRCPSLLPMTL